MLLNKFNLLTAQFASKSEVRPQLAGVLIKNNKTISTDSFMLMEIDMPAPELQKEFPQTPGTIFKDYNNVIIPAGALSKIKIKENKKLPILNNIATATTGDALDIVLVTTDLVQADQKTIRLIEGEFPEYEQLIPDGPGKYEITLNAEYIARICNVMAQFSNLQDVKISFYDKNMPVKFEAKNSEGQKATALLMPLRK